MMHSVSVDDNARFTVSNSISSSSLGSAGGRSKKGGKVDRQMLIANEETAVSTAGGGNGSTMPGSPASAAALAANYGSTGSFATGIPFRTLGFCRNARISS